MNAENIYKLIEQTFTVNKALLTEGFINEYLDSRDSKNFDEKWIDAYEHMKVLSSSNKEFLVQDNTLREKIFKIVVSISSSYELAEYVSDDAGLIYASIFFNVKNKPYFENFGMICGYISFLERFLIEFLYEYTEL